MVNAIAIGYVFYANHTLDGPMDVRSLEIGKCYIFEILPYNSRLLLLTSNDQNHSILLGNIFQSFNIRFGTDIRGFGHHNHHYKIMHISEIPVLHFPTNGHARGHSVYDLHLNM